MPAKRRTQLGRYARRGTDAEIAEANVWMREALKPHQHEWDYNADNRPYCRGCGHVATDEELKANHNALYGAEIVGE